MNSKTIGILGGGQLGRMSALAAANLGLKVVIFTPEQDSPASHVSAQTIVAGYDNQSALRRFADLVDVVTYEFENIPLETIRYLKSLGKTVYPDEILLEVSQDRIAEKSFLNKIHIDTTRWQKYMGQNSIEAAFSAWNSDQIIIKTTRFGYDGKGQIKLTKGDNISDTLGQLKGELILEEIVDFAHEISIICARDIFKNMVTLGPMLNVHKNHILHKTTYPAPISPALIDESIQKIKTLAEEIDLTGILTLELFLTKDGRLLANEIAPRTHNSGHWSMDACLHSQFDLHIRAVAGMPVIDPAPHSQAEMLNLIGNEVALASDYLSNPNAKMHLYGKTETRDGRKMGHINILRKP
jgi:5-(carboxyamino)imidazole ribonucleotide synthase